jgi:hypothetical protein
MPLPRLATAPLLASFALVCAGTMLAGTARGADNAAPPPAGSARPILTPEQLRDCLAEKERLRKDAEAALKAKADIDAEKAEIARIDSQLGEQAAGVDRTNADALAAYNAKVAARNQRADSFQTKAAAYNKDAETLNASRDAHVAACDNRRYENRDPAAAQPQPQPQKKK